MPLAFMSLCQREEGRQCLRELLRWEEFDDVRDLRRSIELDSLYSSIVFAMEKGLSWPAVVEAGKLAEELMNETKGLPISQAIRVLKDKLVACEPKLSPFKPCVLGEYFYHTLIRHYQLYQFVLCRERDVEQTSAHLEICVPPQPLPLMAGIEAEVWHYQQQLAALSAAEVQKRTNMLLLRETLHLEREHMLQRACMPTHPGAFLAEYLKEVIGTQIQALHEILQTEIQTTFEILELRLQKRALSLNPPVPYPPPPPLEERTKKSTKAQEQKKKKK
uniref:Chromosome 8 open reading frame 74 n=1 Tax=Chrysemys picta bellii TaxID=8478 RepID=A0A8C3I807_CHRPI